MFIASVAICSFSLYLLNLSPLLGINSSGFSRKSRETEQTERIEGLLPEFTLDFVQCAAQRISFQPIDL